MNFCLFMSALVVVSLGPWATAKDVILHLGKTRVRGGGGGGAEETKRKLSGDVGLPIINGLVQVASKAKSCTQWLRRLLKALKKWCHSHPAEVKLGKCFAGYFKIKIPGVRGFEKAIGHDDESNIIKHQKTSKMIQTNHYWDMKKERNYATDGGILKRIALLWNSFIPEIRDFLRESKKLFLRYKRAIFNNDFAVCIWEYVSKKFWIWVDSAPDFRSWL